MQGRSYVHGLSYVDERLMMKNCSNDRPYYYVLDRMYCVWLLLDRAGAVVERYAYDEYGRLLIRESMGRGDFLINGMCDGYDNEAFYEVYPLGTRWDPRADLDDDGDVDATDDTLFWTKADVWDDGIVTVAQAFSDVGNPFGFQGRVHFALDTLASATDGKLMLVDHRNRMNDPVGGRWITRDPLNYNLERLDRGRRLLPGARSKRYTLFPAFDVAGYQFSESRPITISDPSGLGWLNTPCEVCWCFAFSACCSQIWSIDDDIAQEQTTRFGSVGNNDNGPWNAIKHCVMQCSVAGQSYCECVMAKALGDCHELGGMKTPSGRMDLMNNLQGRLCAGCSGSMGMGGFPPSPPFSRKDMSECYDCCITKLVSGELTFIEWDPPEVDPGDDPYVWWIWCRAIGYAIGDSRCR